MILLADLGNTRLKLAPLQSDGLPGPVCALSHAAADFSDRLDAALNAIGPVTGVWFASSTPPALSAALQQRLALLAPLRAAQVIDALDGLHLAYREPQRLGIDRYLAMLAVRQRGVQHGLVVLVGTAMTIDALAPGGQHLGGLILPSPRSMRDTLSQSAGHLPRDPGSLHDFASSTVDALHSGCLLAAASLVERSLARLQRAVAQPSRVMLAGGGAAELLPALGVANELLPDLVLEGLARWGHAVATS
jgi:type III pantothenate kinase